MLIGREEEVKKLNELYDSGEAELIALYGRRRVGKTYLIDEVFEKRICFRHAGLSPIDDNDETITKYRMKDQLEHFYRSLTVHGYKGEQAPKSWLEAFYMLEDLLMEKYDDKKGTYKVSVNAIAAGDKNHSKATKNITFTVVVK